jgi:hypothetical protein
MRSSSSTDPSGQCRSSCPNPENPGGTCRSAAARTGVHAGVFAHVPGQRHRAAWPQQVQPSARGPPGIRQQKEEQAADQLVEAALLARRVRRVPGVTGEH